MVVLFLPQRGLIKKDLINSLSFTMIYAKKKSLPEFIKEVFMNHSDSYGFSPMSLLESLIS